MESEWSSIEDFSLSLSDALAQQMSTIKETELDRPGMYQRARLEFENSHNNCVVDVFVDRLRRVVLPAEEVYNRLLRISFIHPNGGDGVLDTRNVIRMEPRYDGSRKSALVIYLEAKEGDHE